jgi:PleD family two-component response regulator
MDEAYSNSSPIAARNPSRPLATDGVRAEVAMGRLVGRDSPLDGVRVLPVESHAVVREVISRLLVEFGAVVTATAGVAEALEAFERERPDVVLSDIGMGDEDGYALIRKLRALPRDSGGQTPAAGPHGVERGRASRPGAPVGVPILRGETG